MTNILSVGNVLIDAFLQIHDANHHCKVNSDNEMCVKMGEKILLDSSEFLLGGNACNVAIGLSRLGVASALVAEVGNDEFSAKILNGLQTERVSSTHLIHTSGPSSFAIGLNFKNERTLFVQHAHRAHDFHFSHIETDGVYLTSLGDEWYTAYNRVHAFIRERQIPLYFNPGSHQLEAGREALLPFISDTTILFLNKEEAAVIVDPDETDTNKLLRDLQAFGAKIVSITDGSSGSFCIDRAGKIYQQAIIKGDVVERTGAGDGYTSGFLSAYLQGKNIAESMRWGALNAVSVIGQMGAQSGLLQHDTLKQKAEAYN